MATQVRRHDLQPRAARSIALGLAAVSLLIGAVACDTPARTPRPSPSLIILSFSPRPSATASPAPTPGPSLASWPVGWDVGFCDMFGQAVDAQQLLVDVQLDIDDGNNHDARLLADELVQGAQATTEAIGTLPAWADARSSIVAISGLMDLAARSGTSYQAWFANGKRADLRQAKSLRSANGDQVPDANAGLAALADLGLTCPGTQLSLEAPK